MEAVDVCLGNELVVQGGGKDQVWLQPSVLVSVHHNVSKGHFLLVLVVACDDNDELRPGRRRDVYCGAFCSPSC